MRSFASFSLLTTLACAIFSSAAPIAPADSGVALDNVGAAPAVGATPVVPSHDVPTLPDLLFRVTTELQPTCAKIGSVSADVKVYITLLEEVKVVLAEAVVVVQAIAADPKGAVLVLAGRVCSLVDLAGLVATLLGLVLGALKVVLGAVATAEISLIRPLVNDVALLLGQLLIAIFALVTGLLAEVLPLIADLIPFILNLNVATIIKCLGLTVTY